MLPETASPLGKGQRNRSGLNFNAPMRGLFCRRQSKLNLFSCQERQTKSKKVIDDLRRWLNSALAKVPPKSLTGQAIAYMDGQWPKLIRFLDDPVIGLDTNVVENAIRPFALGRKNWFFSDTVKGANASAALYSLVITARANSVEPYDYLTHIFAELPRATTADDIEALLPWNFSIKH
jgi:transposase